MPLSKIEKTSNNVLWGLWEINESVEALYQLLAPQGFDLERYQQKKIDKTKKEFLASRILASQLLQQLGKEYCGITRDENNKPHFNDCDYNVSISHSEKYAAVLIDTDKSAGIDVQKIRDKILNIGERVLSESELEDTQQDITKQTIYWSAKEALYKLQGRKGINFIDHLRIEPFELKADHGAFKAAITKPDVAMEVDVQFKILGEFVVVYRV